MQVGGGIRSGGADPGRARAATPSACWWARWRRPTPQLVGRLAAETGRVVVALDCLDGRVRTHGWVRGHRRRGRLRSSSRLTAAGVRDFLVTGIERDGTGRGPDLDLLRSVRAAVPGLLLAAGGRRARPPMSTTAVAAGADAVVVGRAMLDGSIKFA